MMNDDSKLCEVLEGIFYVEAGNMFVPGNDEPLQDILAPFIDEGVLVVVHHHPPNNQLDLEHWGAGSCMWEPTGHCPYGHHDEPHKLFAVEMRGTLRREGTDWFVGTEKLDLTPLEGHLSRLVVTLLEPPASLTDSLDDIDPMKVDPEELTMRLRNLSSLASGLTSILEGFKSEGQDA